MKDSPKSVPAWQGDWKGRIAQEVSLCGVTSLRELIAAKQWSTFPEVADGIGAVAPIQVLFALREEYVREGTIRDFAADALCKYLTEYLGGAVRSRDLEGRAASAFAVWEVALGSASRRAADSVWHELLPRLKTGWLPRDSRDPTLSLVFDACHWELSPAE